MKHHALISRINLLLGLLILVFVNLVSSNTYARLDLTANNAYSLSRVSRETLARVEDPLRVKIFYNEEVPAPYNGVRRYLLDIMREFDAAGSEYFSYEVIDPTTDAGRQDAQRYGLQQVEIQEIRSDEFASRAVFMGAVVLYGNVVERVDRLTATDGLEYRLTTAMRSAVTQVDALSGTDEAITLRVFASPTLRELQIQGFPELETQMAAIHERINRDNYGRLDYTFHAPEAVGEIERIADEYGVQPVRWESQGGRTEQGLLEIVLTYGDRVERIPLQIYSGLFGGYSLDEPAALEESVRQGLRSLVSADPRIAYSVTAGEKAPDDAQRGAGPFAQLVEETYELVSVDLSSEPVPAGVDTLILNGPTERYGDAALYRIDQFVMGGGSLLVFLDSHVQNVPTQQQMMAGVQPTWDTVDTGLTEVLAHWGVNVTEQIVLDEESFVSRGRGGQQQLYQAPIITGAGINRELVITEGLENIIVLNATELLPFVEVNAADQADADDAVDDAGADGAGQGDEADATVRPTYVPVLRTSPDSWVVASPSEVGPWISGVPAAADTGRRDVAVLLEGRFDSFFDTPVELQLPTTGDARIDDAQQGDVASTAAQEDTPTLSTERFRSRSVEPGKVMVISASALTTAQMIDPQNRTPNGTFLMNAVDYLNGAPGFAELRSKGLGVPRLEIASPATRVVARWSNTILVPALIVVVGVIVWTRRRARSRRIRSMFDDRTEGAS